MSKALSADSASQHRAAAAFALAFASATVTALGGVFALKLFSYSFVPVFGLEMLPDSTWPAHWLPGAVSAAQQQRAGAEQWLHVILLFATLTVAIACVNALIGLLSHANERRYETAVRGIVGASTRQLQSALRRNAFVNAGVGILAGVPSGLMAALLMSTTWPTQGAPLTLRTWALLALCLTLLVALAAARMSGRRLRRAGWMGAALAPAARTVPGWGAEDLRALLVKAQIACAVALTTVSLLAWSAALATTSPARNSAAHARSGFINLARINLPDQLTTQQRRMTYARLQDNAAQHDNVVAESIASPGVLLGMGKIDKVIAECGRCARANLFTPLFAVETQQHVIGDSFFDAVGIAVLRGREFDRNTDNGHNVVVNDTFARLAFMGQDPIGKRIMPGGFGGEWFRVIGVVPDIATVGLRYFAADPLVSGPNQATNAPAIYFSASTYAPASFDIVIRTRTPAIQLAGFDFQPLTKLLMRAAAPQKSFARVVALLGIMLCGAAAIGTFVTTMLNVQSRRAEIALRRAVGARRRQVWLLVFWSVARVAAQGIAIGLISALTLARAIEVFVPGMRAFDEDIALGVSAAFALIMLLSALLPVREALDIAPAQGAQA